MTEQPSQGVDSSSWEAVTFSATLTVVAAEDALRAMEMGRSNNTAGQWEAAERISAIAPEFDRPDLEMRSQLILADLDGRQGAPLVATAKLVEDIRAQAEATGEAYAAARSHFLLTWIQHALGGLPAARIHGIRSVELLPEDAPSAVLIDHLFMLATVSGSGAEADRCHARALDIAATTGDMHSAIRIHNTIAFNACNAGAADKASAHVEQMLTLSTTRGIRLKAAWLETIARTYLLIERYDEALAILEPVTEWTLDALESNGGGVLYTGPSVLPEILTTMAKAHRLLSNFRQAQLFIDRAIDSSEISGLRPTRVRAMAEQANLYADMGDFKRAFEQHVAFYNAVNEMRSEEEEARARTVQATFDANEQRRDAQRFRELAMRDALTGLYNRRFIDEHLAALTSASAEQRTPLSAAIADADFFKRINDELSHETGDQVLRILANLLASSVIEPETVGRLGGEEFAILMPGLTASEAVTRCEEFRRAIDDYDWSPIAKSVPVTVSIGVSTAADGQTSPAAILSDADRNLYAAKRSGRNRVMGDSQ